MTRFGIHSFVVGFLTLVILPAGLHAEAGNAPDFQELYRAIKAHANVDESELNRAAVQGLLAELGSKVQLIVNDKVIAADTPVMSKTTVFDDGIAYFRIAHVAGNLASDLNRAFQQINSTNKLNGLVLDLRYADGMDYAAAAAVAELFIDKPRPLLNYGSGMVSSHGKTNAIQVPLAILVNSGTSGSAEALAAVLRSAGAGLVIGSKTAGLALAGQDYDLKNGAKLRVATSPVTLGNGTTLSTNGIRPDIEVSVNPEDEHSYYADSFFVIRKINQLAMAGGSGTNQPAGTNGNRRARFGEAELVREHRAGIDRETGETPRREPEPEKPVVSDPALARALDLLKGLAVVRHARY
ncbi:MAG TPA: S41 family peptidase [Candidatus Paceibacterota bacterium]|nr:S41 family peptidase [Candidatus Paceibacterota bacterium]